MLLGGEGFDYIDASVNSMDDRNTQLGALGWYGITGDVLIQNFSAFGGRSLKFANTNNPRGSVYLRNQIQEGFIGCRMYIQDNAEGRDPFITIYNAVTLEPQASVVFKPFGVLLITLGDHTDMAPVLTTTSAGTYFLNTWFYIEVGARIETGTGGHLEVRINTVPIVDFINIDTQTGAGAFFDTISLGMSSFGDDEVWFDDMYWADNTGSENNDFLGNVRVQGLLPDGAGDQTEFTPSGAATNWEAASNGLIDDTTYVFSDVVDEYDLYTVTPLVNSPTVFGVQVKGAYRQDDGGQRFAQNVLLSGATTTDGTPFALNQSYSFVIDMFEQDPDTSMNWIYTDVNDIQIGPKVET